MNRKKIFENEHWYVTNIDHISLKVEVSNGAVVTSVINDKSDYYFYLPNSKSKMINSKKDLDKKIKNYFDIFFNLDELTFMKENTNEDNYADYINLYTDLYWIKNKLGLTIWKRNSII